MRKLFVIAFFVASLSIPGYFYFRKPVPAIERIDDPNNTAVWTCPGCPKGSSVSYTDRRNPKQVVYYYDSGQDGDLDTIQLGDFHQTGVDDLGIAQGYYDQRVEIRDKKYDVDDWNAKARNWKDGRSATLRKSEEAQRFQQQYKEVRTEYLKLHPNSDLAENHPRVLPSPEPIRAAKVKLFQDLLTEYRRENEAAGKARTRHANERAQLRAYIAFLDMSKAYRNLNETEKTSLFTPGANLPRGANIDGRGEMTQIFGISMTSENPREDFEEGFLALSYMEVDYMSAWGLTEKEQQQIENSYRQELRSKGLVVN